MAVRCALLCSELRRSGLAVKGRTVRLEMHLWPLEISCFAMIDILSSRHIVCPGGGVWKQRSSYRDLSLATGTPHTLLATMMMCSHNTTGISSCQWVYACLPDPVMDEGMSIAALERLGQPAWRLPRRPSAFRSRPGSTSPSPQPPTCPETVTTFPWPATWRPSAPLAPTARGATLSSAPTQATSCIG